MHTYVEMICTNKRTHYLPEKESNHSKLATTREANDSFGTGFHTLKAHVLKAHLLNRFD